MDKTVDVEMNDGLGSRFLRTFEAELIEVDLYKCKHKKRQERIKYVKKIKKMLNALQERNPYDDSFHIGRYSNEQSHTTLPLPCYIHYSCTHKMHQQIPSTILQ